MTALPRGWTSLPIGELISLNPKTDASDDTIAGFSPMPRLGTRYRDSVGFEQRQWGEIRKSYVHFQDGDVLLAKITPCFENGKAGLVRGMPSGIGAGSSEYFVCRPDTSLLDPRCLLAFFKTERFLKEGETRMTGSVGHKRVPKDYLLSTEIPLPPLAEQQRIADKLDALLARVDACRDRLDRLPAILKRFRQSVLSSAMLGALTEDWRVAQDEHSEGVKLAEQLEANHVAAGGHRAGNAAEPTEGVHDLSVETFPSGWGLATLRDAVDPQRPITYGILKPGPELSDGIPYVRVADFPNDRLALDGIRRTSPAIDAEFKRSRLRAGDLLLSIRGTVGRLIEIPQELENANITQDTARLAIQSLLSRSFVLWYLRSEHAQSRMRRAVKGVAVRGINIGDVRALQLPVPSRAEQDEIVRRIEALFALADAIEARYSNARAQVDRLTPAVLAKAFRGELVPQDPNDEPASALLERLRNGEDTVRQTPSRRGKRSSANSTATA